MLYGIDINQRIEFVSKYDKDEPQTVFIFKPLSGSDVFSLQGEQDHFIIRVLNKSIVEIKNIPNNLKKEEYINTLPSKVLNELFDKFNEINQISDDDKKN